MSGPNKYREWILDTIDSLRSRKARPDLERICRMVRRRHGSDPNRTRTELEKLIEERTVLKVSYKGSISYRNAAKAQRKIRKKSEFTAAEGGAAEEERTPGHRPNNTGDGFTDQEEGEEEEEEEDSEPSPDGHSQRAPSAMHQTLQPSSSTSSGHTAGSDAGSGCKEETARAPRNKELGRQGSDRTRVPDGGDGSGRTSSRAGAVCAGEEPGRSGARTHNKTCSRSVSSIPPPPQHAEKQTGTAGRQHVANRDLGDGSAAAIRSPSERDLRGASVAPTRGPVRPLGLKEILGHPSSQEQLSEEKLTRGKVSVVMEREAVAAARGRLRRTRCRDVTLPLRGPVVEGVNVSADGLTKEAPQEKRAPEKENGTMETAGEEEGREENDEEEEDPRSSEEDGGLSLVAMTMEPQSLKTSAGVEPLRSHQQQLRFKAVDPSGVSEPDALTMMPCPPVRGGSLLESNSLPFEEERAIVPDQVNTETQTQIQLDTIDHNSSSFDSSESKTEIGVSSCLLTPTASPRDSCLSEERGMNGGVSSGGFEVDRGSPVDWTVSDVVSYFTAAGFPEQAAAFRAQEIDGKSLLLMQRIDVLTGLSIRLGPALKIYERHVKVLQKMHFEEDDS